MKIPTATTTGPWINALDCSASGSEFETTATIRAGSNELTVEDPGDFRVGQEVTVSDCNIHHYGTVYNDKQPYFAPNQKPLTDEIELRGLAEGKTWQTFIVHFDRPAFEGCGVGSMSRLHKGCACRAHATTGNAQPVTFSWMAIDPAYQTFRSTEPVLHRKWIWQGEGLELSDDWIPLADGVELRFGKRDWLPGESVSFHARNRLLARIENIEGNTLRLDKKATLDASDAVVRHHDQAALQSALDKAVAEQKGLLIPAGRYRLSEGLWMRNASVRIEGAHRDHTVLDLSEAHTAAFWISGGREVTIRNLAMEGHTGFLELPANSSFATANGYPYWPTANQQMEIKGCAAVNFVGTEHLVFEDLEVRRMASEAFYSHGMDRYGTPPYVQAPHEELPEIHQQYTRSCSFHRCRVIDCGFNAFNNNDHAENTNIINCHVERTANFCENASRFTRIIGNYVKDGCPTSVHAGSADDPRQIGPTQAIIADNVFEAGILGGGVSVGNCATQVTIANNVFVGYSKESAIFLLGGRRITVTGNQIDLTRIEDNPDNERCGICVEASNVVIADNQIAVRGERSDKVTGIHIADHAVNVSIHDNLIENCGHGLRTGQRVFVPDAQGHDFVFRPTESQVAEVTADRRFTETAVPVLCDVMAPYRGWQVRWNTGSAAGSTSVVEHYDPETRIVTLEQGADIDVGDRFTLMPSCAAWQIHHNTVIDCATPLEIDTSNTAGITLADNIISPGK